MTKLPKPVTLAFLCLAAPCGAFEPAEYSAHRAAVAPTIDGRLDDPAWAGAQVIKPFYAYQTGGDPPAAPTTLRLLWDDTHLYVAMQATDTDIRSSCALAGDCGHDASIFNGDVLELFVRPRQDATRYAEFEWSPLGEDFDAFFTSRFGSPGVAWESGMVSAVVVDGTVDNPSDTDRGWVAEARIPLASLGGAPTAGDRWTFTGARYDYFNPASPRGPALSMSTRGDPDAPNGGVTNGFHTYEIYDTLIFSGRVVPEPGTASLLLAATIAALLRRHRHA